MSFGHLVGVILTGGASKRMGVDKSTLVVDGKPMVVSVADALWEAGCDPVECQGGDVAAIAEYGLLVVPDLRPGLGPLVAIHEALVRHERCDVVVAACDLADLDADTVASLVAAGRADPHCDVAVAVADGARHMLAWWRAGTGVRLGVAIGDGVVAYNEGLSRLQTLEVRVPAAAIRNVNTPADAAPADVDSNR